MTLRPPKRRGANHRAARLAPTGRQRRRLVAPPPERPKRVKQIDMDTAIVDYLVDTFETAGKALASLENTDDD